MAPAAEGEQIFVFHTKGKGMKVHQTLFDLMDYSPLGSSVHGILQARILEREPCSPVGDLPDPGFEPMSLMSPALVGGIFTRTTTWEALVLH